jgi:histidine phosphotransferase ChpT
MTHASNLSALLASRICHDLISPIGAIGNGLELLVMSGAGGGGPEITLINDSVVQANARIRFYRIAFGVSAPGQQIGRAEILAILSDMIAGGRLTVEWHIPAELPRADAKLAFLVLLCLESALPYGGRIRMDLSEDLRWTVSAQSLKLRHDPMLWSLMSEAGPEDRISPAQVQFLIAREEARDQGRSIVAKAMTDEMRLSF